MLLFRWLNQNAIWIFAIGVVISLYLNASRWRRDLSLARQYAQDAALKLPALIGPPVTLLVAAWNEAPIIQAFIAAFHRLRYPLKQLVLVAGGVDGTYLLAQELAGEDVTVLEQFPGEGKQCALRRGLPHARGEIIFFTDADCILQDEPFERTLQPLIEAGEHACSGASHASPERFRNVFIASQTAVQFYTALHAPFYAPGLFGRNFAVTRSALEKSGGLQAEAPTGTDYVLAKIFTQSGFLLRQNSLSRMLSRASTSLLAYLRQQRRWMLNVIRHGRRYHAPAEACQVLLSAFTGLIMLLLPWLAVPGGSFILAVWSVLFTHALLARLRYLGAAHRAIGLPVLLPLVLFQPVMLFIDFIAWALPLFSLLNPRRRVVW